MIRTTNRLLLLLLMAFISSCGQPEIVFPGDQSCECDDDDDNDDNNDTGDYPSGPYNVKEGSTFPKLTWDALLDGEETQFKSVDVYEQREEKKALVLVISAET